MQDSQFVPQFKDSVFKKFAAAEIFLVCALSLMHLPHLTHGGVDRSVQKGPASRLFAILCRN